MDTKKTCRGCKQTKKLSYFSKSSSTGDRLQNRCKLCQSKYYQRNREHMRNQHKSYHRRIRQEVLEHYGDCCVCCGEDNYNFLALDHINGGGYKHRKEVSCMYLWARKHDMPPIFRVLCHNCNMAKGVYGYCPHDRDTNIQDLQQV